MSALAGTAVPLYAMIGFPITVGGVAEITKSANKSGPIGNASNVGDVGTVLSSILRLNT